MVKLVKANSLNCLAIGILHKVSIAKKLTHFNVKTDIIGNFSKLILGRALVRSFILHSRVKNYKGPLPCNMEPLAHEH